MSKNEHQYYAGQNRTIENLSGYLFIMPAVIILGIFFFVPAIRLFYLGFTNFNLLGGKGDFIGIKNYQAMPADADFINSIGVTFKMALLIVPVQTLLSLIMAVFVNQKLKGVQIFRTIFFVPAVISFVAVAIVWKQMYSPTFGLANTVLDFLHLPTFQFLSSKSQALVSLVVTCIWKSWGYFMIIFLSGLQDIPGEIRESAKIDGANPIQEFIYIIIPMVKKVTLFVLIITTMDAIKLFIPTFIMTSGNPVGSTNVVVYHIWRQAFRLQKVGYAAAMSTVLFVIIVAITLLQFKLAGKDEN